MALVQLIATKKGAKELVTTDVKKPKKIMKDTDDFIIVPKFSSAGVVNGSTILIKDAACKDGIAAYDVLETPTQISMLKDPSLTTNPFAQDKSLALTATGTVQGDSLALTKYLNEITGGIADTGVKIIAAAADAKIVVINNTTTAKKVYPDTGDTIDGGAANASISLAAGATVHLYAKDATNWISVTF